MNSLPPLGKADLRIMAILKEAHNDGGMKVEQIGPLLKQMYNKDTNDSAVLARIHGLKQIDLVYEMGEKHQLTSRALSHIKFLQENQPELFRETLSPGQPMLA